MVEPADPMEQLEKAIMARLGATTSAVSDDPTLALLLPGGLHSRTGSTDVFPFLTISLVTMAEDGTFGGTYRWRFDYGLAVTDESEAVDATSAALHRVYELLQNATEADLPMEDFTLGYCRRRNRVGTAPQVNGVEYQRITDIWHFELFKLEAA